MSKSTKSTNSATELIDKISEYVSPSKLSPERQYFSLVKRYRLLKQLSLSIDKRLTCIFAPTGYGKTCLMQLLREKLMTLGEHVEWLSLDKEDSDARRLVYNIVASAVFSGLKGIDEQVLDDIFTKDIPLVNTLNVLAQRIEASGNKFTLILDGIENINSDIFTDVIDPILMNFPNNFHLVISSTISKKFPLSKYRLKGWLNEITVSDLIFTIDEMVPFFTPLLDTKQIEIVQKITLGWPVAMRFLKIRLDKSTDVVSIIKTFDGEDDVIFDYFIQEFLPKLSKASESFLLEISVMEFFTIESANYIRNSSDSELIIRHLELTDSFILLNAHHKDQYRLHPLLQRTLCLHLRLNFNTKYQQLHYKAAEWVSLQGDTIHAIRHALKIDQKELAVSIIENAGGVQIWNESGMESLRVVHELLGNDIITARPRLLLIRSLIYLKDGRLNDAREIISQVRLDSEKETNHFLDLDLAVVTEALALYEGKDITDEIKNLYELMSSDGQKNKILHSYLHTSRCISQYQYGQFSEAKKSAVKGTSILRKYKKTFGAAYFDFHYGAIDFAEGNLEDTLSHLKRAHRCWRQKFSTDKDMKLIYDVQMSEWLLEKNDILKAKKLLGNAIERLANGEAWHNIYAIGYITYLSINFETKGLKSSQEKGAKAIQYIEQEGLKKQKRLLVAIECGLLTRSKKSDEARHLVQKNGLSLKDYRSSNNCKVLIKERYIIVVSLCRLLIAEQRYEEVIQQLDYFIKVEKNINHVRAIVKYSLLKAMAIFCGGGNRNKEAAFELLSQVLFQARISGYVRLLLDEKLYLIDLLESYVLIDSHSEKDHAMFLLNLMYPKKVKETPEVLLTQRERQVLFELTQGHSNKIIARNLSISENTIHFHLKNIYLKLNVSNRIQAVEKSHTIF